MKKAEDVALTAVCVGILLAMAAIVADGADAPRLYVAGDNEAGIEVRRVLSKVAAQYENMACFDLGADEKSADLTLKVSEHEAAGGINAFLGRAPATTVVIGQLTDKSGKVVWEDAKEGGAGLVHDGAGAGAHALLRSLWKAQGCDKWRGRRAQ